MAWYNPFTWDNPLTAGQKDPEKYDRNSEAGVAARTFGNNVNRSFDIGPNQVDRTESNQVRGRQMGLADILNSAMTGQGPSAAGAAASAARDRGLSDAASLVSGRRGVSGGAAFRQAAQMGALTGQRASQDEAIGRMNEMTQARGELGGLLSNVRGMDSQLASQDAQLRQDTNRANQAAQLGIAGQEMAARGRQEEMEFTNLDPGSKSYFSDAVSAIGSIFASGGVVTPKKMPAYADGVVVGGGNPQYQLMGIGQRRVPISKGDLDLGRTLAMSVMNFLGAAKSNDSEEPKSGPSGPFALPEIINPKNAAMLALKKGGIVPGPTTALVGEAGPEAIVDIRGVVDGPTVTTLGARGTPQAVIPLNGHQGDDRNRVFADIVKVSRNMSRGRV